MSGTTISFGSVAVLTTSNTNYFRVAFNPHSNGQFVAVYSVYPSGRAITGQIASALITPNLTADNYIGISDGAYANAATATIQVVGATDDAQSGLTTGSKYYVQTDGTLSTTAGDPSVYAGIALSATKLLIKG